MRIAVSMTVLATTLACSLASAPAHARARVFVASYGNDSNPCTFLSPCKTFQQAVNVVDPGGEVTAIDSAGFGPINITKAVTIASPAGVEAGIAAPASSSAAIGINAGTSDIINLSGLTLDGANVHDSVGLQFASGASLNIRDSVIRNFDCCGINFAPSQPTNTTQNQFYMSHTLVSNNNEGVQIYPSGIGTTLGVFDHVAMVNNKSDGVTFSANATQTISFTVTESVVANNNVGIIAASNNSGALVNIMVRNSTIANNSLGLSAEGNSGATIFVTRSAITGNTTGWNTLAGSAMVLSYADNTIDGNIFNFGPPTIGYK
jgi:hypothetical protein